MTLESPPADDQFTTIVRWIGEQAKDASRVEVPFVSVTPAVEDWWSLDSRAEIEVPLGRAGATNLQYMRLGKGTSQHVLISGKTGSGKSTLLHAMITNLSLYYSPDEVHFYLVDFKKGVEFKPYASLNLPHARVIAIESEREFGMSVLQRLDVELRRRGDLFRAQGVQDLRAYRDANPDVRLPRVLLMIDEFQEFFVQDDKISQDAALLLDRLVRQGRGVRHPCAAGLPDVGRGLYSGPQHAGPDGGPHRAAVQRVRRAPDPERRQHGRTPAQPARRSDLQRRQRLVRGQSSFPGRLAPGSRARALPAAIVRAGHSPPTAAAAGDRLRGQHGRGPEQERVAACLSAAATADGSGGPARLARRRRGHQGSRLRGLPPAGRQQLADRRSTGADGAGHVGQLHRQPGRRTVRTPRDSGWRAAFV